MNNGEIYMIQSYVERETEKKIMYIAQCALDGTFDSFAIRKADIDTILKALSAL